MMAERWCSCSISTACVAVDQLPGQMTISASGPLNGAVHVSGLAAAGGFSAAADGTLHLNGGQAPTGSLQIKASAADLRPLHRAMTGQPGTATPVSASAIVGFAGADVSLTDLIVGAGKSSVRGRLDLKLANPLGISGDIAADDVDVAAVSAMLFGLPSAAPASGAAWSHEPIGAGAFGVANGAVSFKFDRAALTPAWVARDLKGVVRLQPAQIALSDLDGSFAGGRLTGEIAVSHDARGFRAARAIELAGANAAKVLGTRQERRRPHHGEAARGRPGSDSRGACRLAARRRHDLARRWRLCRDRSGGVRCRNPCRGPKRRDRAAENPRRSQRCHGQRPARRCRRRTRTLRSPPGKFILPIRP